MIDAKFIRENPETFEAAMQSRGVAFDTKWFLRIDKAHRNALTGEQEAESKRNQLAKEIGQKKGRGEDTSELEADAALLHFTAAMWETSAEGAAKILHDLLALMPNIPDVAVPRGKDETENVPIDPLDEPTVFSFEAEEHWALGEGLGLMDFERARHLSGSRFVVLHADLARLHRALGNFMLDLHTEEHGYREVAPPLLVQEKILYGTGQLPKMADDLFHTGDGRWLIPTAEVPLTALYSDEILDRENLPIRLVALTPCFRAEAGAAGRDTRGMLRQHQFDKVELVSLTLPEESDAELMRMRSKAEAVLKALELPYRVVDLCTGDLGFAAARTFDLEVWLPGQGLYREISSCSNCRDFQARRLRARFREPGKKGTQFVHTLNGSGVAVGRALIAVLENHQREDGSIVIPKVLRPYMRGQEVLAPASPSKK